MKIFIGSSSEAADKSNPEKNVLLKVAGILRNAGAEPLPWNRKPSIFKASMAVIENLEEIVEREHIKASVFIYSEDDKTWFRGEKHKVPRDNVVFEHGLFTGILGRKKAITIKVGNVKIPSDLHGLTCIDFNNPEFAELDLIQWVKDIQNSEQGNNYKDAGILRASFMNYPPACMKDTKTGKMSGIFVDVLQKVCDNLGKKLEWTEEVGWDSQIEGLESDRFDIVGSPVWANPKRGELTTMSIPLYCSPIGVFVRENENRFSTNLDLI